LSACSPSSTQQPTRGAMYFFVRPAHFRHAGLLVCFLVCLLAVFTLASPPLEPPVAYAVQPAAPFTAISAGATHSCGLRPDGSGSCWGDNSHGQLSLPAGRFKQLVAGYLSTCAIGDDDTLVCWGRPLLPPTGSFTTIVAYDYAWCGIRTD